MNRDMHLCKLSHVNCHCDFHHGSIIRITQMYNIFWRQFFPRNGESWHCKLYFGFGPDKMPDSALYFNISSRHPHCFAVIHSLAYFQLHVDTSEKMNRIEIFSIFHRRNLVNYDGGECPF